MNAQLEKMKFNNYERAFCEVDALLEMSSEEERNKVSQKFRDFIKSKKDKNYVFTVDSTKTLMEQNISHEAKIVLSLMYRSYFCDAEERRKLEENDKKELYDKYDPNKLFEKNKKYESEENLDLPVVIDKLNWHQKLKKTIFNWIKQSKIR